MLIRLQQRRGTSDQWTSANTVLAAGEMAISTDDQTFRVGDGTTAYNSLPAFVNLEQITAAGIQVLGASTTYTDGVLASATNALTTAITDSATAQQGYTDAQLAALVDSAPETLNTLNEIATALQSNDGDIDVITTALGTKSNSDHVHAIGDLSDVDVSLVEANQILYFDTADSVWKPRTLSGLDELTVSTTTASEGGSLSYDSASGEITFAPAVTGVTAGAFASLNATGPFAASTGSFHTYNDGAQDLSVTITTSVSYVNLVSLIADHMSNSYTAAKLYRVVDSVETELFSWTIIIGDDYSWNFYDQHDLEPGTTVTYLLKGKGATATSYIGNNSDVQFWVQEVAGALGGQPTSPNVSVETAPTGTSTGALSYLDGVITYTPVIPAAAALSELTDVDLTGLGDADVLAYDLASDTWLPGSAASSVAQLSDVNLNGLADESILTYSTATSTWEASPIDIAPSLVSFNNQTASYTLVITDKDKMVEFSSASGVTLSVPTNATVPFPVGTTITIMQAGAGQVTVAAISGVTLYYTPSVKTRTLYSSATLVKRATNLWYLMGDLE